MGGGLQAAGGQDQDRRALSGGGRGASGRRNSDGGALGTAGGPAIGAGPCFGLPVQPGGYAWWYVDALSDDGRLGLTLIAFIGSVFSPYYAWARRHGSGDPTNHIGLNVALYGPRKRWALTEHGRTRLDRGADWLRIGPSALEWDGAILTIRIDEITVPIPRRLRGTVRVRPSAIEADVHTLDAQGRHRWSPIAPSARVEVALDAPALHWSGPGYLDSNEGDRPLEDDFVRWDWSRAHAPSATTVLYDATRRDGTRACLALRYRDTGGLEILPPPPELPLPATKWRVARATRAEQPTFVVRTLEDTPFYARSVLSAQDGNAVHESLSLDRFRAPWVQAMLPFRMPRAWR